MANVKSICGIPVYDEEAHKKIRQMSGTVDEQVKKLDTLRTETEEAVSEMRVSMGEQMASAEQRLQGAVDSMESRVEEMEASVSDTLQTTQTIMNGRLNAMQETIDSEMEEKKAEIDASLSTISNKVPITPTGGAFEIQTGTVSDVSSSGKTVTFSPAFSGVPVVVATSGTEQTSLKIRDLTATGFRVVSGVENNDACQWIAIYIKPASEV